MGKANIAGPTEAAIKDNGFKTGFLEQVNMNGLMAERYESDKSSMTESG